MKLEHVFIVNPVAGKKDQTQYIKETLDSIPNFDYILYNTKEVGDATKFVKNMCMENPDKEIRFYACGGDGTLNEVITGLIGYPNASFTCYPCGSGNDFVKATKDKDFSDLTALLDGYEKEIDLIKVNGFNSINIVNIGFDAAVSYNMAKFKKWPLVSGKGAYNLSLVYSLFNDMRHKGKLYVDDELVYEGKFLLTAACNGICCGGGYYFMPKAEIDSGHIDQMFVKGISLFKFLRYVKRFKNGTYENYPKLMKYINLYQAKKIKVISTNNKYLKFGYDGENGIAKEINIEIIPQALRFFVPNKTKNLDKETKK